MMLKKIRSFLIPLSKIPGYERRQILSAIYDGIFEMPVGAATYLLSKNNIGKSLGLTFSCLGLSVMLWGIFHYLIYCFDELKKRRKNESNDLQ